jgi:hypothetical protein
MARFAVLVSRAASGLIVHGTLMGVRELAPLAADRLANGEAFEGEAIVRLPRRFSRADAFVVALELSGAMRPERLAAPEGWGAA